MYCPEYIDFERKCQYKVGCLDVDTKFFCSTEEHKNCPYYRTVYKIGYACKYLKECPACDHFAANDFKEFVSISNNYCLSQKNNKNCQRFILRNQGKKPPKNLMPDGSMFEKPIEG